MTTGLNVAELLEGLDIKAHMELVHAVLGDKIGTFFPRPPGRYLRLISPYSQ